MKNLLNTISIILISLFIFSHQNPCIKLSGKPISSDSILKSPINNAFDGDISTVFKSSESSNGWIGLKLDSKYKISKIGVAYPNNAKKEDYLLAILEGSNNPTFFDSVPLYMITEEMKVGEMIYFEIKSNQKYKYIRYIGPNNRYCIISELEIYGDDELDFSQESIKDYNIEKYYYQATNLPLIVIQTEEFIEPYDKINYITCSITIIKDNKIDTKEKGKIKLRGNATFRLEKKSYRIKFDEKINPLGMTAKDKSWTLLANHSDKTLIRNMLALKISSLFEMKYTPECQPVDLILNGEFKGNYGFCDQVKYGKGRIEVTKMDKTNIKNPEISGGYIIAADQWAKMGGDSYYESKKGVIYTIKYPESSDIVPQQIEYIKNIFDLAEDESYNNTIDKIDIETFCKYLLIEDLCGNGEAFWSTYMTKERNDDKFYFGPVWDFDISFDNDMRVYPSLEIKDFIFKYGSSAGTMNTLATKILSNEKTLEKLKEIWKKYIENTVTKENLVKYINDEVKNIDKSQKLNFIRWDILNTLVLVNPKARGSFEAEVNFLKEYILKRFDITDEIVMNASFENVTKNIEKRGGHRRNYKDKKSKQEKIYNNFLLNQEDKK